MLSQEVRYFILENMFIFAEIDYDDDCDSDSVPRDVTTTAITFSPVGFPRRIEVQMRAHFRNRVYSNEFSKTVRCSMIEGDLETKNITLCSNHFMDLPVVRESGDNQVMADIENPQAPGLITRSTAQELHKWLFGNASGTSSTDSYTLLTAIMLSVGAIDCSFAQYTEHFCRVEVSTAKLRKIIAAKGMRASISLKDCNYLYNQRRNAFVYKKVGLNMPWMRWATNLVLWTRCYINLMTSKQQRCVGGKK